MLVDLSFKMSKSEEKKVLTEFLQLYKENPCLWDTLNELHNNRKARDNAYSMLLEKYQLVHEGATMKDVKEKLANMRCAYRREHKKVMAYKIQGYCEYRPTLWYYDLLDFLNQDVLLRPDATTSQKCADNQHVVEEEVIENPTRGTKKPKFTAKSLAQSHHNYDDNSVNYDNTLALSNRESMDFGSTIGLQLQELIPSQRFLAEKLISEVIFYGKMEKLKADSCITTTK